MRAGPMVIYLDSSVVLAQIFAEDRSLPDVTDAGSLISSKLLEYEVWNRIHARGLTGSHGVEAGALLDRVQFIDLAPTVLARALEPFPISVRTLDALHLATIAFLRARGEDVQLASYDRRLVAAARALRIAIYPL
jgi:predicted nucleic acid-binding protein